MTTASKPQRRQRVRWESFTERFNDDPAAPFVYRSSFTWNRTEYSCCWVHEFEGGVDVVYNVRGQLKIDRIRKVTKEPSRS